VAKHRGSVFTVVREEKNWYEGAYDEAQAKYVFSSVIGTYLSLERAEEVVGASQQAFRDAGVSDDNYRFSVKVNTYYDE
jgi:hypothetical protein